MLAEYIDGGLEPRTRAEVEAHLADCEECYENFAEAVRAAGPVAAARPVKTRRGLWYAAAGIAAVAILWLGGGPAISRWLGGNEDARLIALADAVGDNRPALPRLTGGFRWGTPPPVTRGASPAAQPSGAVTTAIGNIEIALERERTPATLRDHAIAEMVLGRAGSAVDALKEAAAIDPRDASVWSNLAAAYLMRSSDGEHASDLPAGYDAASTALSLDRGFAEALFNRALILERMNLANRAADDWNAFLKIDASSKWADEARAHLAALGKASASAAPSDAYASTVRAVEVELPLWAAAMSSNDAAARVALDAARASAAQTAPGDKFLGDVIKNVDAVVQGSGTAKAQLALGVQAFANASARLNQRDLPAAEREYARAVALLQPLGSPLALAGAGQLAEIRDEDSARKTFLAAVKGRRYPRLEAQALWSLGMTAHANGQFTKAGALYKDARAAYVAADDRSGANELDGQLASLSDELGLIDDAWRDRLTAFAGVSTGARTRQQQRLFTTGAFWANRANWPHVAILCSRESIAAAKQLGDAVGEADALNQEAMSLEAVGDHAAAIAAANEARLLIRPDMGAHFASLNAKLALTDAELGLPDVAGAPDRANEAASYYASKSELSRLPEALAIKANRLRAAGKPEVARQTLALGLEQVAALQRQATGSASLAYADSRRPLIDAFVDLAISEGRTEEAFDALEGTRSINEEAPQSMTRIKSQLAPDASLIVYALQRDKVTAFLVRRDAVKVAQIPIDAFALNRLVTAFATRPSASLGAALRRTLVDPLQPDAALSGAIGIVPDGVLHRLTFAALPGRTQKFFVQEHAIVYGLSATSLAGRVGRSSLGQSTPRQMIAIGASAFDRAAFPLLATLPQADAEAGMVAVALPGSHVLSGAAATREALLNALPRADGLHFSGHSVADELRPERSLLVIRGRDQPGITAAQLAAMNLTHVRLAVLAACETASGTISRTAGPLSVVRSMIAAGVGTIVASRTPLDDAVSIRLFRHFYEALVKDGDPIQALQQSQVAMIRDPDPSISDPSRWSGVVVMSGYQGAMESVSLRDARKKR